MKLHRFIHMDGLTASATGFQPSNLRNIRGPPGIPIMLVLWTFRHGPSQKDQDMGNGRFQDFDILMTFLYRVVLTVLEKFLIQCHGLLFLLVVPGGFFVSDCRRKDGCCQVATTAATTVVIVVVVEYHSGLGREFGKVSIVTDMNRLGQFPKSPPIIVRWKNFNHGRSCLEKQEIGGGRTVGQKHNGLLIPPCKLL